MNESVKHALSIVTKSQLRFVSLVNTNIRCPLVSEEAQNEAGPDEETSSIHPVYMELQKLYYICLGKHSFFIYSEFYRQVIQYFHHHNVVATNTIPVYDDLKQKEERAMVIWTDFFNNHDFNFATVFLNKIFAESNYLCN